MTSICSVGGRGCYGDGRYVCFLCHNYCCGECSAIRSYPCYLAGRGKGWKERKRRICSNCWEEAEREKEVTS